ncbi:MAG: hypothetical protein MET45_28185 [Nostoc sp. LLA-1]|nr:hypothetical protein [Cyanocohniella sp. LLY]
MVNQTISNPPTPCTEENSVIGHYICDNSTLNYSNLNTSIQETFAAIDRFEWQASDELRLMRDNSYYEDGAYTSFEDYCESELTKHGGYRRVKDL